MAIEVLAFKKESKVYVTLDQGASYHRIDLYSDFSASQTFDEQAISVKTLHAQADMFDYAVINKANPANFNFTVPLINEGTNQKVLLDLLLTYDNASSEKTLRTCDIILESGNHSYVLRKAVMETGTIQFSKDSIVLLSISGSASKLEKIVPFTVTPVIHNSAPNFITSRIFTVLVNGIEQERITSATIEINNSVEWVENNTLHKSLQVTEPSGTTYPEAFVVSKRNVSGTLVKFLTDAEGVNSWAIGSSLYIATGTPGQFAITLPQIVLTNRLGTDEIFTKSYDFRLISNPSNLRNYFTYQGVIV